MPLGKAVMGEVEWGATVFRYVCKVTQTVY